MTKKLLIILIPLLLTGCVSKQQLHFEDKGEDSEWRRAMAVSEKKTESVKSVSENRGIEVFGKNPVKVVSNKNYKAGEGHNYYYVVMRMTSENGFHMDYVALKGFVEEGMIMKERINVIDTLDFRYGEKRELFLLTTNRATKDAVSRTFSVYPEEYEVIDHVIIDDRLFEVDKYETKNGL